VQLATVVGQVVSTAKDPGLGALTLLLVQDVDSVAGQPALGPAYVAVDLVGAGDGELVLVTRGGAARMAAASRSAPTDCAVVGIADSVVRNAELTYRKS
jgi:ethanolamine utilization protein EutN